LLHPPTPPTDTHTLSLHDALPISILVASSVTIKDDDNDPPCYGAKQEYVGIAQDAGGAFVCTGEYPSAAAPAPLEFTITASGIVDRKSTRLNSSHDQISYAVFCLK